VTFSLLTVKIMYSQESFDEELLRRCKLRLVFVKFEMSSASITLQFSSCDRQYLL